MHIFFFFFGGGGGGGGGVMWGTKQEDREKEEDPNGIPQIPAERVQLANVPKAGSPCRTRAQNRKDQIRGQGDILLQGEYFCGGGGLALS